MARVSELLAAGRTYSFEFFPPKSDGAQLSLGRAISELEPLGPSFVSVTYGAGGSTRQRTREVVTWVRQETSITPMAHLTCFGHTRAEIRTILEDYRAAGIENILALRGDPPPDAEGPGSSDYRYATDLVEDIEPLGCFSIGVAAHPEIRDRRTAPPTAGCSRPSSSGPTSRSPSSSSRPTITCASSTSSTSSASPSRSSPA
jgi:methylenetetrahydrofolate reductase (NADPH)